MNHLENRIEKLEAKAPAKEQRWVQMIFNPANYDSAAAMEAAIDKAATEAEARGECLIARVIVFPPPKPATPAVESESLN